MKFCGNTARYLSRTRISARDTHIADLVTWYENLEPTQFLKNAFTSFLLNIKDSFPYFCFFHISTWYSRVILFVTLAKYIFPLWRAQRYPLIWQFPLSRSSLHIGKVCSVTVLYDVWTVCLILSNDLVFSMFLLERCKSQSPLSSVNLREFVSFMLLNAHL